MVLLATEQVLEGKIQHDKHGWPGYVKIEGKFVKYWIWDRLAEIPEDSYVKIDIEIMDVPHD